MSQSALTLPPPKLSGAALADDIASIAKALASCRSGTARPADVQTPELWIQTLDAVWNLNIWTGTQDVLVAAINPSTGTVALGAAADAAKLGGYSLSEIIAQAQAGTAADANALAGQTLAQVVAQAQAGTAANADKLEGKTKAEVVAEAVGSMSGLPIGTVVAVASESVPSGYLECNGAAISRTTYSALFAAIGARHGAGNGSTTFDLPDYRGRFLRGWDHSAGRDPDTASRTAMATGGQTGDHVGSAQADALKSHAHGAYSLAYNTYAKLAPATTTGTYISDAIASGGNETRPVNAGVMFCIKY